MSLENAAEGLSSAEGASLSDLLHWLQHYGVIL
jgi:hypothetical protein